MDSRKARVNGEPGTLFELINGHITRGGSIERRKKFVSTYALPASNTFGLHSANNQLWVFGSSATPGTIPAGVNYQRLVSASGSANMTALLHAENFDGLIYAIAIYDDGNTYHFYNGNRVVSWDALTSTLASNNAVAAALAADIALQPGITASASSNVVTITALVAGVSYTITETATQIGATVPTITLLQTQANQVAVPEVLAVGSFAVSLVGAPPGAATDVKVNGVDILGATVNWTSSDPVTAQAIAQQINSNTSTPDYTATSSGNIVTIKAVAGSGSSPNGFTVTSTTTGSLVAQSFTAMAGGVDAVAAEAETYTATIGGTFDPANIFSIVINGVNHQVSGSSASVGTWAKTFKGKMYSSAQSLIFFSTNLDPTLYQDSGTSIGSGFINVSNQDTGSDAILGIGTYQGDLAFFARNNIQVWAVDPDPTANAFVGSIPNTGSRSPKSIQPFGNTDVFYLSDSGVKSLKARDASGAAFANDVGAAIADHLLAYMSTLNDNQITQAPSVLEPGTDRYWVAIANRIYVFSYFPIYTANLGVYMPSGGVSAWSYYDTGSLQFTDFARVLGALYARAGDHIYQYGGTTGQVYPDAGADICTVKLPFLSDKQPATIKQLKSFDLGADGQWDVSIAVDPNDATKKIEVGKFSGSSYTGGQARAGRQTTHIAPELVCSAAGYAAIHNLCVHFDDPHEAK